LCAVWRFAARLIHIASPAHDAHAEQTRSGVSSVGGRRSSTPRAPRVFALRRFCSGAGRSKPNGRSGRRSCRWATGPGRPERRGPQNVRVAGAMRPRSGPTKRGVWARCDEVSIRPKTTSLHDSKYYRAAPGLVLNMRKLWVTGLLHLGEGAIAPLGWRLHLPPLYTRRPLFTEARGSRILANFASTGFSELRVYGALGEKFVLR
jgi:hypothetical protein